MSLFTTPPLQVGRTAAVIAFAAASTLAAAAEIIEYYHPTLDHYFVTGYAPEIRALDGGTITGWRRTGYTFQTFDTGDARSANSVPVCRFYGSPARGLDSHFYSATPLECDDVQRKFANDWMLESNDFFRVHPVDGSTAQCPANTKAVYRLYNKRADVNHRYTTDLAVVDQMLAKGYTLEGNGSATRPVAFCAANVASASAATVSGSAPVCTLASSTPTPTVGVALTLTTTCAGNPTTYAWTNCASTGSSCPTNASVAGIVNYGVVASNASGPGLPATIAINWQVAGSAGQGAASSSPTCTVSASTASPILGSSLTLTGNCSHSPTRYEWLKCSALLADVCNPISECSSATTACSPVGTQVGALNYALRGTNSAGTSAKASIVVSWQSGGAATPPPPVSPTPYCTIAPSSNSPAVNTTLTLTASCTNNPTSFIWGGGCSSASSTCTTTESSPFLRNYTVTASNASGIGAPASVTVGWQQPPTAPPVCTLSSNNTSPYAGAAATLTADCTQSPTLYSWVGCSGNGSTCQASSANAGQAAYAVIASNQFGPGASASTTVNWQTPPATGADFCGSYSQVTRVDLNYGNPPFDTYSTGGFAANAVLAGRIVIPANATGTGSAVISVVEHPAPLADRVMSISTSPCDFRGFVPNSYPQIDTTSASAPLGWSFGPNPQIFYSLSGTGAGGVKLIPGQTYYVNIMNRNYSNNKVSCFIANCDVRITVNRP